MKLYEAERKEWGSTPLERMLDAGFEEAKKGGNTPLAAALIWKDPNGDLVYGVLGDPEMNYEFYPTLWMDHIKIDLRECIQESLEFDVEQWNEQVEEDDE